MKKQAAARHLIRRLQARVELERSLGAGFVATALPPRRDLTRSRDLDGTGGAAAAGAAHGRGASHAPSGERGEQPHAGARAGSSPASARTSSAPDRFAATVSASELGRAAGVDLPPLTGLPLVENKEAALSPLRETALACTRCKLCEGRQHVVFGEGDLNTDLVFVGEAPGRDEDLQGRPFVGRAGELLTAMIEKGMKRSRRSVYICNILKCRPPGNRDPEPDEVRSCTPYLHEQLAVIRPKLIVALGRIAAQILSGERTSMKRLRGRFLRYRGIPLLPVYHPAYLLRARQREGGKTEEDRQTWEDLQKAMVFLASDREETA